MKNFAWVMGVLFGSAWAHTYPKSGEVALPPPPPPLVKRPSGPTECAKVYFMPYHSRSEDITPLSVT